MDKKPVTPDPEDDENIDGCDVEIENPTSDEDLPVAEGGVG
jgi:hypothetical protein